MTNYQEMNFNQLLITLGEVLTEINTRMRELDMSPKRPSAKTFRTFKGLPALANEQLAKFNSYIDLGLIQEKKEKAGVFLNYCYLAYVYMLHVKMQKLDLPPLEHKGFFSRLFSKKENHDLGLEELDLGLLQKKK